MPCACDTLCSPSQQQRSLTCKATRIPFLINTVLSPAERVAPEGGRGPQAAAGGAASGARLGAHAVAGHRGNTGRGEEGARPAAGGLGVAGRGGGREGQGRGGRDTAWGAVPCRGHAVSVGGCRGCVGRAVTEMECAVVVTCWLVSVCDVG